MLTDVFVNETATTEIYTLSLHDALPISRAVGIPYVAGLGVALRYMDGDRQRLAPRVDRGAREQRVRSEEHTSELQSRQYLVCRLLLEKTHNGRTHPCHSRALLNWPNCSL